MACSKCCIASDGLKFDRLHKSVLNYTPAYQAPIQRCSRVEGERVE